jgi:hypothetical protein
MANGGRAKKMKIKVRTDNGKHDPVVGIDGEDEVEPIEVSSEDMEEIHNDKGFKHVGVILYAKSSPGCVYFVVGGRAFRICR